MSDLRERVRAWLAGTMPEGVAAMEREVEQAGVMLKRMADECDSLQSDLNDARTGWERSADALHEQDEEIQALKDHILDALDLLDSHNTTGAAEVLRGILGAHERSEG